MDPGDWAAVGPESRGDQVLMFGIIFYLSLIFPLLSLSVLHAVLADEQTLPSVELDVVRDVKSSAQ